MSDSRFIVRQAAVLGAGVMGAQIAAPNRRSAFCSGMRDPCLP